MRTIFLRLVLFVSSYFPLSLVLFVLQVTRSLWWATGVLLVGTTGLLLLAGNVFIFSSPRFPLHASSCTRVNGAATISYLAYYALPLLTVSLQGWQQAIVFLVLFAVLGCVYVQSGGTDVNPMLSLFGFSSYTVRTSPDERSVTVLARRRILPGQTLWVRALSDDVFIEPFRGEL